MSETTTTPTLDECLEQAYLVETLDAAHREAKSALRAMCEAGGHGDVHIPEGGHHVRAAVTISATLNQGEPGVTTRRKLSDGDILELIADIHGEEEFEKLLDLVHKRRLHWWKGSTPKQAWADVSKRYRGIIHRWLKAKRQYETRPTAPRTSREAAVTVSRLRFGRTGTEDAAA